LKRSIVLLMLILMAVAAIGCSPQDDAPVSKEPPGKGGAAGCLVAPDIEGVVLDVENGDALRVLVDSDAEIKGEIWVTITEETSFFEDVDPDSSIGISDVSRDFKAGNEVAILSDGMILESYPMQTTALAVYQNVAAETTPPEQIK